MAVKVGNARKNFNFKVIMAGVTSFMVQTFTPPEKEIEEVEHGDSNYNVKTPGKASWSNAEMGKLLMVAAPDNAMWQWMLQCQNTTFGVGAALGFQRQIQVIELGPDNVSTLNTHVITCWPSKISYGDKSRVESGENVIETVTFAVNGYDRV